VTCHSQVLVAIGAAGRKRLFHASFMETWNCQSGLSLLGCGGQQQNRTAASLFTAALHETARLLLRNALATG
jgi:hypothetical protein